MRVYNLDRYDDRDVILTNLLDSFDRMITFGQKHLNDSFVLDGMQSVSARDAILREIVSNSLAHRDYSNPYVAQFLIEKDQITIKNGNRAHGIGALNLRTFEPFAKNPAISKVFREIGFADELGSGMRNSYKYTKLYSGAEPEFIEDDIFRIIIPLTTGAMTKVGPGTDIGETTLKNVDRKVPIRSADRKVPIENADKKTTQKTEEHRKEILAFMSDDEWYSSSEIMKSLDVKERRIRTLLNGMIDDGLLISQGERRWKRYKKKNHGG